MTTQLSLGQARVIDPILTRVAQGYRQQDLVGMNLYPAVPVQISGGQILQFGKEAFMRYNTRRAPGSATRRVQFGYLGQHYALENHSLEGVVPRELMRDASVMPGINLGTRAVNNVMRINALELEAQQAALATNTANYDNNHKLALSGAALWSASTGTPIANIKAGREAIRSTVGVYPTVAIFGPPAWTAFTENPTVLDRIKYTQTGIVTEQLAAALLEIPKVVVAKSVSSDDSGNFSDVWGNNCVLAYTALGDINQETPSYGYTYTMEGHPMVEPAYWDANTKSWVYPATYERAAVIAAPMGAFLFPTPA